MKRHGGVNRHPHIKSNQLRGGQLALKSSHPVSIHSEARSESMCSGEEMCLWMGTVTAALASSNNLICGQGLSSLGGFKL